MSDSKDSSSVVPRDPRGGRDNDSDNNSTDGEDATMPERKGSKGIRLDTMGGESMKISLLIDQELSSDRKLKGIADLEDADSDNEADVEASEMFYLSMADAAALVEAGEPIHKRHLVNLVDNVYPVYVRPTKGELRDSVIEETNRSEQLFAQGFWVEMLGKDMVWHLSKVKRVVRQAPDEWDWDDPNNDGKDPPWKYFYNVADRNLVDVRDLRAPELGLKDVFGSRPWLWQQYALLKLERHLRFQKDNERDFEEVDCQFYGNSKFEAWLNHPENRDFKAHYDKQPVQAQLRLVDHLLKPFELMDQIVEDQEQWNFQEDENISVYSYTAMLGSGICVSLAILLIQVVVPFILLYSSLETNDDRYNVDEFADVFTGWSVFENSCSGKGKLDGVMLNVAVLGIYMFKVVPETIYSFTNTTGAKDNVYSRINSLRKVVWDQGDDSLLMQIGYKTEMYMNTAYVCLLYAIMLVILFNTDEVLDIVLNALAIEFIHQIDEQVARVGWYDPDHRWIRGGCLEIVLRSTLRLDHLATPSLLAKEYDIDMDALKKAIGTNALGQCNSLKNSALAHKDDQSTRYMTPEDGVWLLCAQWAVKKHNKMAVSQFQKPIIQFGSIFRMLYRLGLSKTGYFNRFTEYRTWSRWEKVIYLSHIPGEGMQSVNSTVDADDSTARVGAISPKFRKLRNGYFGNIIVVLSGLSLLQSIRTMAARKRLYIIPYKIIDGIFNWFLVLIQLAFPFFIVCMLVLIIRCY